MRSNNDKVLCYLPSSSFPGKKLLNILSLPVAKIKIRPINGGGSLLIINILIQIIQCNYIVRIEGTVGAGRAGKHK